MTNQPNQNSHILYTGPGGWTYYAWSKDGRLPSTSVEDLSKELNIDVNQDLLLDGDDVESFREFVHVIAKVSRIHGFTHLVDPDAECDNPTPIHEVINRSLTTGGWTPEDQKRILKGLDISHLTS